MPKLMLGRKIGMTQIYDEQGALQAATVVQLEPGVVTDIRTPGRDGYAAVQIGFGSRRRVTKPLAGHIKKSQAGNVAVLRELRLAEASGADQFSVGQRIDIDTFAAGETVTVTGTSKGKGYAGVVKRHGFAGGPGSHGSDFHRAPGAIGGRWPQRVRKGRRMAGRMGGARTTVHGLKILRLLPEQRLVAIQGALPGPRRGQVELRG